MSGAMVSLVGAGPGDPELLTLGALRRLEEADVVLHDALVAPEVVALAARAARIAVGKRAGRPSFPQQKILELMIAFARRGRRVVRLKCGDPFLFGRGGEEAEALEAAGVPYEVVPGVSAALAAPAAAGIPVTRREVVSGVVIVSGHSPSAYEPILGGLAPGAATVVVLMGLAGAAALARFLAARGWSEGTPAAVVLGAWTAEERVWAGTLAGLARYEPGSSHLAGTIVIGETARRAARAPAARAAVG